MSSLLFEPRTGPPHGSPVWAKPSIEEILACIADAVISTDVDGTIVLFNPAAEKTFGYAAKDVLGTSVHRLLPARFRDDHHAHLQGFSKAPENAARAMASERKVLGRRSDGSEFAAEAMLSCRHFEHSTLLTVVIRDVSQRQALEEQRDFLAAEMAHRFGNLMAMVQSVIALTAKSVSSVEQFRSVLDGRIQAISHNQAALLKPGMQVQFSDLIDSELAPFRRETVDRVTLSGPNLTIPAKQSIGLSLLLHELTTNAVKYGALSVSAGRLKLRWSIQQDGTARRLVLNWIETGGPIVRPPVRRGFGSNLIERSFGEANTSIEYRPEGLVARFQIDLKA